jgi:KDO2-lipid IV(A) lauroyltransferase
VPLVPGRERRPERADPVAMSAGSSDLREGGTWTRAQARKNALLYIAITSALWLTRPLSPALLRRIGRALGGAARVLFPGALAVAHDNVMRVFPDMPPAARRALVRKTYATLGEHLGDALASLAGSPREPLPIDAASLDVLARARAEGRGVIFASAHLGNWERVAASLVAHGVPLVTLTREAYDPRLEPLLTRLRGGHGVGVIPRGSPGAAARIVRTLRRGGVLGAPMDLRSRVPSIDVPFLGLPAPSPVGPARIALRTGAAVVVGTLAPVRDGSSHTVRCTRIRTDDLPGDDAGAAALTARINDELSARIRALPHEWPWMHPRFI